MEANHNDYEYVFNIGNIKSGEVVSISLMLQSPAIYYSDYDNSLSGIEVSSEEFIAFQITKKDIIEEYFIYFFPFVLTMIIIGGISLLLYFIFMPTEKK